MAAARRILLRAPKDTFKVVSPEDAVGRNLIAGNSGNLVFLGAAQRILSAPGVEIRTDGLRIKPAAAAEISERYDAYVIPLANAFRPRYEAQLIQLTELIRRLRIPVSILGVGSQGAIDGDMSRIAPMAGVVRDFVAAVLDHGPTIGVRGELTAEFVRDLGFRDVEVVGCPSMFLHGERIDVAKRAPHLTPESRLVITISPYVGRMRPIVRHHVARYPRLTYVAQDLDTLEMLVWGTPVGRARPDDAIPAHPDHPLIRDGRTRQYIDPWPWLDDLREADFVFGSRIHGTIASLLAGTPAYLLAHDARTLELARYFDIPHRALAGIAPDTDAAALYDEADFGPLTTGQPARFRRFAAYLAAHGLDHAFAHPDAAAAFDRRVAATTYPPAVVIAAGRGRDRSVGGVLRRIQARVRRRLRSDDLRRMRTRVVRILGGVRRPSPEPTPARRILVPADVDRLAEVRAFVRDSVSELGGSSRAAEDLVQAVDEATCNVMLHGYGHQPGSIEIEAALRDGRIEIRLLDRGPTFDPTAAPTSDTSRPPESKRPGGMGVGIHLLRTMTDEVRHHVRPDGGNELTLVRSIDDPAREG